MLVGDSYEPSKLRDGCDKVESISVDYFIVGQNGKFAVERKTWMDLVSSTRDGRLWNQLKRLKDLEATEGYKPMLIIEGYKFLLFKKRIIKISQAQLDGIELGVVKMGVPIMYTENMDRTMMVLRHIDKDVGDATEWVRPTIPKTGRTGQEEVEDVISAIDGIGRKSAQKLLKTFGSVKGVINAETVDLATVVGIREAKHLEDTFERKY